MEFADSFANMNWTDVTTTGIREEIEARQFVIDGPPDFKPGVPQSENNDNKIEDSKDSMMRLSPLNSAKGDPNHQRGPSNLIK